jgi:hypothetical protein
MDALVNQQLNQIFSNNNYLTFEIDVYTMSRIANAIGIVKSVLEKNHSDAVVKTAEPGDCDFRVSSVGASISVTSYGDSELTNEDVDMILEKSASEIDGRHLESVGAKGTRDSTGDDSYWFDLKS